MKKVLVIGFGSIGKRHVRLLRDMGLLVHVYSRRSFPEEIEYQSLGVALKEVDPEYVVIANETSEHFSTLNTVLSFDVPQVLVEKPLFTFPETPLDITISQVCVAYNLRFHPLLRQLRSEIEEETVLSVQVYVGQYLPNWRPHQDYRQSYSVSKALGGGVLRDLSHELDYLNWLFGPWEALTALGGHYSFLEGDSDDVFCLLLQMKHCSAVTLQMNYLDRTGRRQVLVNTDHHTYHLDLVQQKFWVDQESEVSISVEQDETYLAQHRDMLENQGRVCCTLSEGKEILRMIYTAEQAAQGQKWLAR